MSDLSNEPIAEGLDKDAILDFLNTDDDKKPVEAKSEAKVEDTKEEDEETEVKTEDDKEDDEAIKLEAEDELEFQDIPKRKDILAAFPELFKKFPGVEKAIYREQQYAEVFPTITEAKEAQERLAKFSDLEQDLEKGSIESVLKSVSPESFSQITTNFLGTIAKIDQNAYYGILDKIIRGTLSMAFTKGKAAEDDQLQIAAQLLHKFMFNEIEIKPPSEPEAKNTESDKLRQEKLEFNKQRLQEATRDVTDRTSNIIKSTIDKHIDPKGVMTQYLKSNAIKDVLGEIDKAIRSDVRFTKILDNLWKASIADSYSESSRLKIRNALISKAKAVAPDIIAKVRNDALKGIATRTRIKTEEKEDEKPVKRAENRPAPKLDKKMSTLDFLSQD